MSVTQIPIRQLIQKVTEGEVRVPAFQREWVWEPDRVQFLLDSIFKGYPIGTLLLWRTREQLSYDRDLGPYRLPPPEKDYPIDYVLDGQQRITSIFATFQTELPMEPETGVKWVDIYFDLHSEVNAQDSQFLALEAAEVQSHHVPLRLLFDVAEYGKYIRNLDGEDQLKVDALQAKFKEAQIPIETVETEDHSTIAIIFERINRGGIPLDTYQLLSAWTWNGDFDLRKKFDEISIELDDFGFNDLRDEPDLLLKCCAAVIKNSASSRAIVDLKGQEVRDGFDIFKNGLLGAIEFLRKECNVISLKVLPYKSMLISLVRFFATPVTSGFHPNANQRKALKKWFWGSCFSRRYSNSVDTAVQQDIEAMKSLLLNNTSMIDNRKHLVSPEFFLSNTFSINSVNTKTFILLLSMESPKSFLSAADIDLQAVLQSCNRTEFHHVFPKNYLSSVLGISERDRQFMLANFAFLSQSDNRSIQDKPPSEYLKIIPPGSLAQVLKSALIPEGGLEMKYEDFVKARSELLARKANERL